MFPRPSARSFVLLNFFVFMVSYTGYAQNPPGSIYVLPVGTEIRVRMDNEINSRVSSVNDTFSATVSKPVVIRNVEVLRPGAVIEARITAAKQALWGGKNGMLSVRFFSLKLQNGTTRPLDAAIKGLDLNTGNSPAAFNAIVIVGGTSIGAVAGGLAGKSRGGIIGAGIGAGIGMATVFFRKGKEARIKANEEFVLVLQKELSLPAEDF